MFIVNYTNRPLRFKLGSVYVTHGIISNLSISQVVGALDRHGAGDWGELSEHDRNANEFAVNEGGRILSSYRSDSGVKFWVITEADRSATTVLLPSEY